MYPNGPEFTNLRNSTYSTCCQFMAIHISLKKKKKNMVNLEIDLAGINTVTSPKIFFLNILKYNESLFKHQIPN